MECYNHVFQSSLEESLFEFDFSFDLDQNPIDCKIQNSSQDSSSLTLVQGESSILPSWLQSLVGTSRIDHQQQYCGETCLKLVTSNNV